MLNDKRQTGFVGLGPMGLGMARNLVHKGASLAVLGHRRREPVEELVSLGASEAANVGALGAACDIVFLCLPSSKEVEALVLGEDSLAATMRPGSLLVDSTTAEPTSTLRIADSLAARGIRFLDAPLTRTSREADAGRLNVLVGGNAQDLADARPFIELFAENIFHVGPTGTAHKLKLINNFLTIGCASVVLEAVAASQKLGVDTRVLFDVVSQGGANSGAFQMILPWVNDHDMRFRFSIANADKDLGYFTSATKPGPVTQAIQSVFSEAVAVGKGAEWLPLLATLGVSEEPTDR